MRERLLNYSHHLRRLRLMVLVAVLAVPIGAVGQAVKENPDAPNIGFERGTLEGWTLYYGQYQSSGKSQLANFHFDYEGNVGACGKLGFEGAFSGKDGITTSDYYHYPAFDAKLFPCIADNMPSDMPDNYRFYVYGGSDDDHDGVLKNIFGETLNAQKVPSGMSHAVRLGLPHENRLSGNNNRVAYNVCPNGKTSATNGAEFGDGRPKVDGIATGNIIRASSAEAMSYVFECKESTSLLTIKYNAVLDLPSGGNHSADDFKPEFYVKVRLLETGQDICAEFGLDASSNTLFDTDCTRKNDCYRSTGWVTKSFNLLPYIGEKIQIFIGTHDCTYDPNSNRENDQYAGGHNGWMYFTAEARDVSLRTKYCSIEDSAIIVAPAGFDKYIFKVYDASNSVKYEQNGASDSMKFAKGSLLTGCERVECEVIANKATGGVACASTLVAPLSMSKITKDTVITKLCENEVQLLDNSIVNTEESGDEIRGRVWTYSYIDENGNLAREFGTEKTFRSKFEETTDKLAAYNAQNGTNHKVMSLEITTEAGCKVKDSFDVVSNPIAHWSYSTFASCEKAPVEIMFAMDDKNPLYKYYNNLRFSFDDWKSEYQIGQKAYPTQSAESGVQDYKYSVKDKFGCPYEGTVQVDVNPLPLFDIETEPGVNVEIDANGVYHLYVCQGKEATLNFYSGRDYGTDAYELVSYGASAGTQRLTAVQDSRGVYSTPKVSLPVGGYSVSVTDKGCTRELNIEVVTYKESASLNKDLSVCEYGNAEVSIDDVRLNPTPRWYQGTDATGVYVGSGTNITLTSVKAGTDYFVMATDINGCPFTETFQIAMKNKPELNAEFVHRIVDDGKTSNTTLPASKYTRAVDPKTGYDTYTLEPLCPSQGRYTSHIYFNLSNATAAASASADGREYMTQYRYRDLTTNGAWSSWNTGHRGNAVTNMFWGHEVYVGREHVVLFEAQSYIGDEYFCTDTIQVIIKGSSVPTLDLLSYDKNNIGGGNQPYFCEGTEVLLEASPRGSGVDLDKCSYQWFDADNGYSHLGEEKTETWTAAKGVYYDKNNPTRSRKLFGVLMTLENGCKVYAQKHIYPMPLPSVEIETDKSAVCENSMVTLNVKDLVTGVTDADAHWKNNVKDDPSAYVWSYNGKENVGLSGSEQSVMIDANMLVVGKFTSQVIVTAVNGCKDTAVVSVAQHPVFDVIMQNAAVVCSRPDGSVAENAKVDLKFAAVSVAGGSALTAESFTYKVTHKQTGTDGYVVADVPRGQSAELGEFEVSDTYLDEVVEVIEVEVTSSEGCVVKKKFEITVKPYPKVYITADKDFVCDGESLELTANNGSSNVVQNPVLSWLNIGGNVAGNAATALTGTVSFVKNDEGFVDYVAEITSGASCVAYDTFRVYSQDKPDFTVNSVPSSVCENALFTSVLSASANYDNTYFYTQLGKNGNNATWSSAWTEDAVVDGGVSSAKYDVSKQAVMGSASKTYTVRAGMARYGSAGLYRTNAADPKYFCYSEKNVDIGSDEVPAVTAELLSSANSGDKADVICNYKDYYLLVKNQSSSLNIVDVTVNVEGVEKVASLAGGGSAVVGPFTPNSNESAPTININEDKVVLSWKDRVTDCENKSYMTVNFVERPTVNILLNGARTASEKDVCEGSILDLSYEPVISSGASVLSYVWSYGTVSDNNAAIQVTASMLQPSLSYNVKIEDSYGCEAESSVKVNVIEAPKFTAWLTSQDTGVCEGGTDSLIVSDNNNLESGYSYVAYVIGQENSKLLGKEIEVNEPVLDAEGKQEKDEDGNPLFSVKKYYLFELNGLMEALTYRVEAKSKALTECSSYKDVTTKVNKLPVLDIKMTNATTGGDNVFKHDGNGKFPAVCQKDQVQFVISNTTADPSVSTTYKLRRVTANALYDKYSLVTVSGTEEGTTAMLTIDKSHRYEITATTSLGCEVVTYVEVPIKSSVSLATKGNHSTLNYSYLCRDKADNENQELVTLGGNNHMFQIWIDNTSNLSKDNKKWTITGDYINGAGNDYDDIKFDLSKAYQAFENVANPDLGKTSTTFKLWVTDNQGCLREVTHNVRFFPDPDFGKILDNVSPNPVCFEDGKVEVSLENTEVVSYATYTHALSAANLGKSTGKTFKEELKFDGLNANGKVEVDYYAGYMLSGSYNYAGKNMLCVSTKKVEVDVIYKPEFKVVAKKENGTVINAGDKLCPNEEFFLEFEETRSNYSDMVTYTVTDYAGNVVTTAEGQFGGKGQTGSIIADKTTTYTVTAVAKKGCSAVTSTVTVNVERPFSVSIASSKKTSGVSDICKGETVTLSAVGLQASELWNGGVGDDVYEWSTSEKTKDILCAVNDSKSYKVKVKNVNGCWSEEATHNVVVHPNPIVSIEESPSGCAGSDFEVKANATIAEGNIANYKWFSVVTENGPDGMPNTSDDEKKYLYKNEGETFEATFDPSSARYGVVAYSETYGCSDTMDFKVDVLANPDIVVRVDNIPGVFFEECIGTPMTLVASNEKHSNAETTFKWKKRDGTLVDGAIGNSLTVTPNSANEIGLIVEAHVGSCVSSKEISYVGKPNPVAVITANVCSGMPGVLNATVNEEGAKLVWNGDVSANKETYTLQNPQANDVVKLQVTGSNGCITEIEHIVKPVTAPSVTIMGPSGVCLNTNFKLNSTVKMADGVAIRWYKGDGLDADGKAVYGSAPIDQGKDEISQRLTEENKTVYYKVEVTIPDGNGAYCSSSAEFTVTPYPVPSFSVAGVKTCAGSFATFNMVGANNTGYAQNIKEFRWADEDQANKLFPDDTASSSSFMIKPDPAKTTSYYKVYGVSHDGCVTDVKRVSVTVNPLPKVEIKNANGDASDFERCSNDGPIVLKAEITTGQTAVSYDWGFGAGASSEYSFSNVSDHTVKVVVVDNNGCAGSAEQLVKVNLAPTITAVFDGASGDHANSHRYCADPMTPVTLETELGGGVDPDSYSWTLNGVPQNVSQSYINVKLADNDDDSKFKGNSSYSERYGVKVTDVKGCTSPEVFFTVNVDKRPEVEVVAPAAVCPGSETVIQLTGAQYYSVIDPEGNPIPVTGNEHREVLYSDKIFKFQGISALAGEPGACKSDIKEVTAKVKTAPMVSISEPERGGNLQGRVVDACENESVELTATASGGDGNYTYSWSQSSKEATYVQTLSGGSADLYPFTVEVRDGGGTGCPTKATVTFKTTPSPVVFISASKEAVCDEYEQVSLKACHDADCSDSQESGIAYEWKFNRAGVIEGGGTAQTADLGQIESDVKVTLTARMVSTGCVSKVAEKTIKRNATPEFSVFDKAGSDILDPSYGKVLVCEGEAANLSVKSTNTSGLKNVEWTMAGSLRSDQSTFVSHNFVRGSSDTTYTVTVQGGNGCYASKEFTVGVKAPIELTVDGPYDPKTGRMVGLCEGTDVVFKAFSSDGAEISWTAPLSKKNSAQLDYTLTGNQVRLEVTATLDGCIQTLSKDYKIYDSPSIGLEPKDPTLKDRSNSICEGSSVELTAVVYSLGLQNDVEWQWLNEEYIPFSDMSEVSVTPAKSGKYYLEGIMVYDGNTVCKSTKEINITVVGKPKISASFTPSDSVCSNESVILNLGGANAYRWNKGTMYDDLNAEAVNGGQLNIGMDHVAGTVNEYAIKGYGVHQFTSGEVLICEADTIVNLMVYAAPNVSLSAPETSCPDVDVMMIASGAEEYLWSGADINGLTTDYVKVKPQSAAVTYDYTVYGTKVVDSNTGKTCKASASATVKILPKSRINMLGEKKVCAGNNAMIKAEGVSLDGKQPYVDFIWSTGEKGDSISSLIMEDTKIFVTGRDTNNCFVKDSVMITAQDPAGFNLSLDPSVNTKVCEGSAVTLKVVGATEYEWEDDPENTTSQMQVSPVSNTTYNVKGTYGVCTKILPIEVYIVSAPAISIVGNTVVCRNSTMELQATSQTSGLVFKWEGTDAAGDKLSVVPTIDGEKYIVTATDPDGKHCKASKSVTVTLREAPEVKISGDLTVCENTYGDLNVGGAVSYVWGYEDADGNPVNNVAGGTNYQPKMEDKDLVVFVDGTDSYGCKNSDTVIVSHVAPPSVKINGVDQICAGQAVSLTAGGNAETYVWNGKDTSASVNETLETSKTYSLKGISTEGCVAETRLLVTVVQNPILSLSGNTTLCQGDVLRVKAHGADSYTWGGGASPDGYPDSMSMKMPEAGIKEVALTGVTGGCSTTQNFEINVKKAPSVQIEGDKETCANVSLPLKAVSEDEITTYTWTNNLNNVSLAGQSVSPVITQDVTYTVKAGNIYGCTGTETINVKVVSSPDLIVSANIEFGKPLKETTLEFNDLGVAYVSVCDGTDLDLQVRGAKTFKWDHRDSVYTSYTSLDTTITSSATFVVTGFITGCDASRTIVVNHKANPSIDLLGKRVVCEGSPVTLEPIGTDSFEWNGKGVVPEEDGTKLIAFTPTVKNFKYTLVGIDTVNNCQTVRTYTDISFNSKPEFTVSGEKEVCVNESITLNAFAVDPANDEGNYSYTWGYDKDSKKAFDLDSELEVTAFEAGVDQLFASVKDSVGCVDTLFFEVTKKPLPTLTFDAKGSDNDPSTPEIIDICMKNDLYAYINGGGASITQENGKVSSTIKDKPVKDTIYKVSGELNGCVNTLEIPVRTIPSPIVYLTNYAEDEELTYCEGSPVKLVVGGNAVSYTMPDGTKGANGATYVDEEADGLMTYFITGEGDNGCSVQEEFTFKMNTLPEVAIDIEKDQDRICYREVAELHVTGAESYKWSTGSRKDTIKATITKDSLFTVVGRDTNGCESEASFKVTMVELPVLAYNGDTEFCDGNTATLRGSGTGVGGGDYYAWSIGKDTIAMGNLATTKLNGNTTYTLWGKSKEGCVSSLDVDITAKEAPILFWEGEYELNETADSILLCQKQTLDITMKGADTYQWTGGSTTDRLTVVPTRSTHYTVTGTGANGCKTTQAINVKVLPTPTIKIDAPTFACVGEDFQMKVTDDTKDNFESFAWSNHSTEATSGDLTMTEEDYTLKVTGYTSLNCPAEASFTVKPKALPKLYVRGTKEICKGGVFSLHGQGANTYAWFMDENDYYGNDTAKVGDQISFEAATDEVLVMSGTLNGCTDTIHVPLSVQTPPILHTEGLKPICQGEVLELIAKATNVNEEDKVEFSWSAGSVSGELGDTMRMTPLSSQEIYLTGSVVLLDENGEQIYCKNTLEIPVTVNTKPTIEVEGERTVCYGTEAKFTAVGAAAYEWVELESSSETVRPIITSDTSLTVRGKDTETGCDAEAVVKVKVKPLPVLGVANGSKVILCDGEEADITVFGAATYGWRQSDGSLVAGNRYKHTPEQDTIYRVIGTSNNNCVDSMDIEVTVNMLPSLSYSGDSEICSGDSLILFGHSAPEGCTFVWSNGDKGDKMEAKPLVSASYKLTGTDANGCFSTIEIPVVVNQRIPLALAGPVSVCEGSQAKIYAKDAKDFVAFNWSNGNVGDTIRPDVLEKTTFFVDATDGNGCVTRAEFTVDAISIPELAFSGDTVVCLGEEVSLLADGARDYIWKDVDGNVLYKGALYKFVPEVATKLILEGYLSDCKSEREIPITVNAVPNLVVEMPEFICRGSVGELRASAGAGATFLWSTGETEKNIEVTPLKSTAYTVTATNEYGCDSSKTEVVLVVEPPKVLMGTSKDMVCPDQADSVYFSATGAVSYEWSSVPAVADIDIYNSDKQNFWAVLNEGEDVAVTVVGTDEKGCETKVTKIIAQRELEPMQFIINPNCIDATNPEVRFSGKVPDHEDAVWTWTPGEGLDPVTISKDKNGSMVYRYDLPLKDSFEVKVHSVDEHGCIQEGSGWVYKWRDFWAAEAFTPDGDGLNDEFYFHGGDFIEEFSYIIYNRMGEIIYEGKSIEDKWDGNYKGEPCPTGVYGWTAKYGNNSATLSKKGERKGMVTIVR